MSTNEKFVNYYIEHLTDASKEFLLNAITNKTNLRLSQELIDDYTKQIVELDAIITDLRSELEIVKTGNSEDAAQKILALETDVSSHLATIGNLNADISRLNILKEENERSKQQLVHLESFKNELQQVRADNQKLKTDHDVAKIELQKTKEESDKLKSQYETTISNLSNQLNDASSKGISTEEVQNQIDAVKSEYDAKIAELNNQLANVEPVIQTVVQEVIKEVVREADTSEYDAKIADLTNQINVLTEKNQKLSEVSEVPVSSSTDNSELIAQYEAKVAELTQKLNDAAQNQPTTQVDTSSQDAKIAELTNNIDSITKKYEAKIVEMNGVKNNLVSMYESQIHELSNNSGVGSEIEKKFNDLVEEYNKYKATSDKRMLQLNNQSNLIRSDYEKKLTELGNQKNNLNAMYERKISEMQNQITQLQSLNK